MSRMTVSDILLKLLAELGVRQIFGIPGDAINGLVDAVRRQDTIEFIQVRHEEAGAFAASAQAKLTGRLAVCVGTAGPGAVHLLNGLYDAKRDHAPVLAITGQVPTRFVGTDYHQELDLYTLFKDATVFNETVMTPEQVPALLVEACQMALAHGEPAHLALPVNIAGAAVDTPKPWPTVFSDPGTIMPHDDDLDAAAEILNGAGKVAILAGIGCRDAAEDVLAMAEKLNAPVVRSLRAKGVIPDEHPLVMGGVGLLGDRPGVEALENCDAFLMVGTDFPYQDFYPDGTPAVQIDRDPARIGKRYPVSQGLVGEAGPSLRALAGRIEQKSDRGFLESCQKTREHWRRHMERQESDDAIPIRPQRVARALSDLAADDAVFLCDTGTVTVWGARHLRLKQTQQFTLSANLASMAFGMSAAIGAQFLYPKRQVIALVGDGGFSMLMQDFLTAVRYKLPITVVIINNSKLGLITVEEETAGLPDFATELPNPDFAEYARLCGGEGYRVTEPDDLNAALEKALASDKPCVVDVLTNPDELPLPPKIQWAQAAGFAKAKIKELFD